jgi:hypothetical protein
MNQRERLTKAVAEPERELDAARTWTALNAAPEAMQTSIPPERPRLRVVGAEDAPGTYS